jgi:hypothetical protein
MTKVSLMYGSQSDLARRWGVTRQRVHALSRREGFPTPCMEIGGVPVYKLDECERWHKANVDTRRRVA